MPRRCPLLLCCHNHASQRGAVDTQLIAHDKEVYDIAWGGAGVFASVSADGSVRVFDLRDKEHSTIIYETEKPDMPLLRLAWNKQVREYWGGVGVYTHAAVLLLCGTHTTMPPLDDPCPPGPPVPCHVDDG